MLDLNDSDGANDDTVCLASAAERLRAVRRAQERFLALWAVDHLLSDGAALRRAWSDLDASGVGDDDAGPVVSDNPCDLGGVTRSLFRGGRLDD